MRPNLTLYHYWRSSCSWRVRWALALKGVPYTSVPVDILAGEHRTPAYLARNPAGALPTLEIDGTPYSESLALLEWLDETWPTPRLLPTEPLARLRARRLALVVAAGTQPLQNPSLVAHFVPDEAKRKPHVQHFIARGLGLYETLLAAADPAAFSVGDQVTLADLCLVPQVYNALRFEVDVTPLPLLRGIYERCLATPACDAAAPHHQPGAS